jgi:glycosyltransferase involved in cell wall biosynthesis
MYWKLFNQRAAIEINKRKQSKDFICIIMGDLNLPLVEQVEGGVAVVEYGIGYNGPLPRKPGRYRVYESYIHMHKLWGAEGGRDPDGYFYDAVIPNYFDPTDYPLQVEKGDYYLYLGRLIKRKGIHVAVETCKRLGVKLKIGGQGCVKVEGNKIFAADGEVYEGDNLEYVGFASGQKRASLYQNAIATFVPTTYIEPFGGVAVESQMAGTPVLTTDFGAFAETVEHGRTGFRCHTLNEFIHGARAARELDAAYCHYRACKLYSMDNVRWQFQRYFNRLLDLWGEGWYACHDYPDPRWLRAAI